MASLSASETLAASGPAAMMRARSAALRGRYFVIAGSSVKASTSVTISAPHPCAAHPQSPVSSSNIVHEPGDDNGGRSAAGREQLGDLERMLRASSGSRETGAVDVAQQVKARSGARRVPETHHRCATIKANRGAGGRAR